MKLSLLIILLSIAYTQTYIYAQNIGKATYYSPKLEGKKTASGEVYDAKKYTAAHKTLPFGTYVEVKNTNNDLLIKVKINDRLHTKSKSLIDLSYAAANELNMIKNGYTNVVLNIVVDSINNNDMNHKD